MGSSGRIFHFSDDPAIEVFEPRPVLVPSERPPGMAWLNGPLVWAVSEERQVTYLFPRDCPRILVWDTPRTSDEDRRRWWGDGDRHVVAHVEWAWFERLRGGTLHRYELPPEPFEAVDGDWTFVAREPVRPLRVERITDLLTAIRLAGAELRVVPTLTHLRDVWSTSVHASGIRLRNADGW